jgi:hypothetical protein
MPEHRRADAIAAARAALEELRRLRAKGVEWKELREAYSPNGALSENMLRDYVSEKRHFAGKRGAPSRPSPPPGP